MGRYLKADIAENVELEECLLWKWWSKDKVDIQNVRVEIVDKLFFLISLAFAAGLDANELFRLYMIKYEINMRRLETGYLMATKDESENRIVV